MPALIMATASGMLVTKATSQMAWARKSRASSSATRGPCSIGAIILLGLAAVPGLPKLPFLVLAGGLWYACAAASNLRET